MMGGVYSTCGLYAKFQSNDLYRRDDTQYTDEDETIMLRWMIMLKKKLRGLSPHANYTDRAAAAGRRS